VPPDGIHGANARLADYVNEPGECAKTAITMPAPKSHVEALAQNVFAVCQNATSQAKAATKKAIGNGISMGGEDDPQCSRWIGD
jgi:hypothetical protein